MPKVSVITVCFNNEKDISKTLESIFDQTMRDFELIIQDGGSTDNTNIIVQDEVKKLNRDINVIHNIEEDAGIYDAMNKAIKYSSGEWCIFMNAGDTFFDNNVLRDCEFDNVPHDIGVLYGHTMAKLCLGYNLVIVHNHDTLINGCMIGHQSTFIRKSILMSYQFAASYQIRSDYDQLLRIYMSGVKFSQVNMIIAIFERGGISTVKIGTSMYEKKEILRKYELSSTRISQLERRLLDFVGKHMTLVSDLKYIWNNMSSMARRYK